MTNFRMGVASTAIMPAVRDTHAGTMPGFYLLMVT